MLETARVTAGRFFVAPPPVPKLSPGAAEPIAGDRQEFHKSEFIQKVCSIPQRWLRIFRLKGRVEVQHPKIEPSNVRPRSRLSKTEIQNAYERDGQYGPILTLEDAAQIANVAISTMRRLVSEGRFKDSVKRGKPLLFWRDSFVHELMN